MATTTNYSWTTPDDTALVKDGAAAIRSLGTAIDTTVFNNAGAAIAKTIVDAKGDIIAATAADTVSRLAVGANDTVLTADSSTATGLKWGTVQSGGMTLLNSGNTSLSGSTITFSSLGGYETLLINIFGLNPSSSTAIGLMRFNSDTGSNYSQAEFTNSPGVSEGTAGQNSTAINLNRFGRSYLNQNTTNYWNFEIFDYNRASTRVIRYNVAETGPTLSQGTARYGGSSDITSLTLLLDTGTFSSGTCEIWGIK